MAFTLRWLDYRLQESHLHVAARAIPFSNHKVSTKAVIPCYIKISTSIVVEIDVGEVIGPILDGIEAVLASLQCVFDRGRTGSAEERCCDADNRKELHNDMKEED
jgi:hypothetical protein